MKRICITYHMHIDHSKPSDDLPHNIETVETCITLPMRDEVADDILENEEESQYLRFMGEVRNILEHISELQGYHFSGVCFVEDEPQAVHGKWIDNGYDVWCSICDEPAFFDSDYGYQKFAHCPSCGAKMDKE